MHRILSQALWTSLAALGAGTWLFACASDDARAPSSRWEDCNHPGCGSTDASPDSDASKEKDSGPDVVQADVAKYDGPVKTLTGHLWWMKTPTFNPFSTDHTNLGAPARLRVYYFQHDYTAIYDPDGGFALKDLPYANDLGLLSEDIDGGNGLMSTYWPFGVTPEQGNTLEIGVVAAKDIADILASVTPPLQLDPTKAQVMMTILVSGGNTGVGSILVTPPKPAEAVLYYADDKWQRDLATGTGNDGMALIVNMEATPYPGDLMVFQYNKPPTAKGKTAGFIPVAQGAISIVYQYEAWSEY